MRPNCALRSGKSPNRGDGRNLSAVAVQSMGSGPVIERVLLSGWPCMQQYFQFCNGEVFIVGNGPSTTKECHRRSRDAVNWPV